mgnify:CR=1 FL=1|jgi:hypothetical protein
MDNFKLPPVPKDVLVAFEFLPQEVLDKIDLKVIAFTLQQIYRNPTQFKEEESFAELFIINHKERMRLIRIAAKEHGHE